MIDRFLVGIRGFGTSPDAFTVIESVERAVVDGGDGLVMLWTQRTLDQGVRRFGLIARGDELADFENRGGIQRVLADLHLMAVEPHGTMADETTRTWFTSVSDFIV